MTLVTGFLRLINPPTEGMAERNGPAITLNYALVPIAGSLTSLLILLLAFWAGICLVLGRLRWRPYGAAAPILWSHLAFFLVLALADFVNGPPGAAALDTLLRGFFLFPLFAVHRVAISRPKSTMDAVFLGAVIGGLLVPFVAIAVMLATGDSRAAALAGNSGPLSIIALLTAGLAMLAIGADRTPVRNAVALLGAFGASVTVLLTGMRGAWPALPIVLAIALWARRSDIAAIWRRLSRRGRLAAIGALAGLAFVGVALAASVVGDRIERFAADFNELLAEPNASSSLSLRAEMYEAGTQALGERPILGWGEADSWNAVEPHLGPAFAEGFSFTHLHNIVLTVGVQAGIVGIAALAALLIAPIWCAFRNRHREAGHERLAFSLVLVLAFLVPGLTNIMFFHDILDSVWVLSAWTIAGTLMARDGEGSDGQGA